MWAQHALAALDRLEHRVYEGTSYTFTTDIVPTSRCASLKGASCYGAAGEVFCDEATVARILAALSLSTSSIDTSEIDAGGHKAMGMQLKLRPWAALQLADASDRGGPDAIAAVLKRLVDTNQISIEDSAKTVITSRITEEIDLDQRKAVEVMSRVAPVDRPLMFYAYAMYEEASTLALAYVVGHELAHAHGRCAVSDPGGTEANNVAAKIIALQADGKLLCPNALSADELAADMCGLRVTRAFATALAASRKGTGVVSDQLLTGLQMLAKRSAIDAIDQLHMTGLGTRTQDTLVYGGSGSDGLPQYATVASYTKGYIYPSLRTILFAAEMHDELQSPQVGVCDNTAQDVVLGLNMARHVCSESDAAGLAPVSDLADALAELVPPGVVVGWKTGHWDDSDFASFRCPDGTQPPP